MDEFTKEQLIGQAQKSVVVLRGAVDRIPGASEAAVIHLHLAEIALAALTAGMEQEPVAYIDPFTFKNFATFRAGETDNKRMGREWMWAKPDAGLIPLYAAPQLPQPAVPDENGLLRCPFCGSAARVVDNRLGFYVQCCSDNCDGLAIGPRVPELQSDQEEKSIDWESLAQAAKDKWNRRAAMLQGAEPVSQPVIYEHVRREYRVEGSPWIQCSKEAYDRRKAAGYEVRELYERPQNSPQNIPGNIPDGWVAVPVEPTEKMVIEGFESAPHPLFQPADWDKYQTMSGCEQAAHRAKLCWAAMIKAAPKP